MESVPYIKKNIAMFIASQTVSMFGSGLVQYAIMWYITLETKSGVMMTISIICGFIPTFIISPFAGVWADRYDRRKLIIWSDFMIAASTLVLAIIFLMGYNAIWMLFVVSAIRAIGSGMQAPAVGAFIPQIVPEDKLISVNGMRSGIQAGVMLVCPMLSAVLLGAVGIEVIFFIDVVTAAAAIAIMIFFLHVEPHAGALKEHPLSYFHDMRDGLRYIRGHSFVKAFFLFCMLFFFLASPAALLTPLQVVRTFGDEVWKLSAIEVLFSVGMMAGGFILVGWQGFRNKTHTMVLSAASVGLLTFTLGITSNFWIYLVEMALIGLSLPFFNTPSTAILQEKVEKAYLGRVFGVLEMISSIFMPLGMLVFGPLADMFRIEWMLIGTGILMFTQGLLMLRSKSMIEAGAPTGSVIALEDNQ